MVSATASTQARRSRRVRGATERVEARVTPEVKELLVRAAILEGRSLSDFVVSSAQRAAIETLRDREVIRLNEEETERFYAAILDPPEPNDYMRESLRLRRQLIKG